MTKSAAESVSQPVPIGLRVANAMHKLGVYGLPRNYELFYDALTGANAELNAEFWKLGRTPNQEKLDELYARFYKHNNDHEFVERTREVLENHLGDAIEMLKAEQSSISAYGRVLDKTANTVETDMKEMSPVVFLRIVEVLANATGSTLKQGRNALMTMIEKSGELESMKQELEEYKQLVDTDPLTGVWNRRAFDNKMTEIDKGNRKKTALLIIDIDHFKTINDKYGHPFGDVIIRDTAQTISSKLRHDVFVARTGGEEFAVLLDSADAALGDKIADRLVQAIREAEFTHEGVNLPSGNVTVSIGVCSMPPATSGADLYSKADQALYESKKKGRDCKTVFGEGPAHAIPERKDYYLYRA